MKTINLTRTLLLATGMFIFASVSFAGKTAKDPATDIRQAIQQTVKFPTLSNRDCCTGTVDVLFTVTADGKLDIKKINSDNDRIVKEVKEQLAKVSCADLKCPSYQMYSIQITFKFV
jgi:outer membrane biosynthesis protein TonB